MPNRCVVTGSDKTLKDDVSFHFFPKMNNCHFARVSLTFAVHIFISFFTFGEEMKTDIIFRSFYHNLPLMTPIWHVDECCLKINKIKE